MLRRRNKKPPKGPREARHEAHATPAPRSRRRARPDVEVPAALRLPEDIERELREAAKAKAETRPPREAPKAKPVPPPPREAPKVKAGPPPAARPPRAEPVRDAEPPREAGQPRQRSPRGEGVILVTGFEPFGGEASNPSWEVCKRLPREIAGRRVETCRVPCEFRTAIEVVAEAIERHRPEIVLSLGQAGGRSQMGVERVAINVDDARDPDNAGYQPVDEPVAENGPPAYFATLPVKAMVAAMRAANVPTELSNSAGTYVCNHLMYGVLHFLAASGTAGRAGFVHVPYAEEQVLDKRGMAGMAIASMARGVEAALVAACSHQRDIATTEGALD